ncbi:MAG TPA: hypothetical protein VMF69_26695 [Gemmataceae bacterium]|nr:hypothetical protein [Gemmataceae bacterium]
MPWPLSQDYNEALQNPQSSFSDPELRQGQVAVNTLGIPQPCSGNFADVYAVDCPATKTKWAVKCFTREVRGLRERYSEISSYLQQVRLPFTVDFQYLEQGIRIAGRWYPILKMHWVEGLTLNAFVRDMVDKPAMLEKLSRIWVRMARRLREAELTHCDLQHGNVLLVPDSEAQALAVKLIDYDGMWVPALSKTPSGEFGHPSYQHPRRLRDSVYNAEVDRFPLLSVHVALRALIAGGRKIWERYDTGDNLLFRQADFEAPTKSPLFAELLRMNPPEVRDLTVKLIDAARMPLEQTPHLTDLATEEKAAAPAVSRSQSPKAAAATGRPPAKASDANPFQNSEAGKTRREQGDSLIPWIATGSVAACAVVGGLLLWGMQAGGSSKKPSTQPALAQTESGAAAAPQETKPPTQVDKIDQPPLIDAHKKNAPPSANATKPSDPPRSPTQPKAENPPAKPAPAQANKPEQPVMAGKMPVPDEDAQKKATEDIRDIYKADYASNDPAARAALAEKLLKRGQKEHESPERRFVFLREASGAAAKAGDSVLSIRALEELGKLFAVEEMPMKTAALQMTAKYIVALDTSKALLETAGDLLAEAIRTDDYEDAEPLFKTAEVAAFKAGIPRSALRDTAEKVKRLKTKYAALKPVFTQLAQEPNDPEANRIVGSFRCFDKDDWENGLPLLLRGDDPKLKELAEKDLAAPTTADERTAMGDGWWTLAQQRAKGAARANIQQRACYWYEPALPDAAEKSRIRMETNIRRHQNDHPILAWGRLDISQADVTLGALQLPKKNKEITTLASFSGPIEATLLARTDKNNIRLRTGKGACVIFNWEKKPKELRITRPDGSNRPESGSLATAPLEPLRPNTWYLLSWRITEEGMTVAVNGRVIFSEEHKNDLSEKHPVSVHSVDSNIEVLSFTVRPIGKKPG